MKITRRYTRPGQGVYDQFDYTRRSSVLRNPDGSVVFMMEDIEVPRGWSQVATDILAQKYFRKAGVPQVDRDGKPILDDDGTQVTGPERSVRQVIHRLAGCWTDWAKRFNYFDSDEDAQAFYDETAYMLLAQMAAPNSPQWFNTGLTWAYGITGPAQGHYFVDPESGKLTRSKDAYTHPQPHACARGTTRLFTSDGTMTIREIVDRGRTDISVYDGDSFVQVLGVKENGVRRIVRATLENGNYLEFTDDHLIWSSDRPTNDGGKFDWHELGELLGWRVRETALPFHRHVPDVTEAERIPAGHEEARTLRRSSLGRTLADSGIRLGTTEPERLQLDIAMAALSGWILGDGHYGTSRRHDPSTAFGAVTVDDDEFAFVTGLFEEIFGDYRTVVRSSTTGLRREVHLDSSRANAFVEQYELASTSTTAHVSERIFCGTRDEKIAFLRSLFQTAGNVRVDDVDRDHSVALHTMSEDLAHDVQTLLLSLGIRSAVSIDSTLGSERQPFYRVAIRSDSEILKYADLIGFVSAHKVERLRSISDTPGEREMNEAAELTITSLEYIGEETVYDIQTASARFVANGVIVHNCFIQSVTDDLVNEGGIFDLITREARIFKYGSGTGSNFSALRAGGEPLSGGGVSSGLMSFLKVADRAAGAVKSGGTTRRAAKMVILNADHPDIEPFVDWKVREEQKVASMVAGSKICNLFLNQIMEVAIQEGIDYKTPGTTLHSLVQRALNRGVPMSYIIRALTLVEQGHDQYPFSTYDTHYEGEAYITVSGQNSNNSVRVTNEFMDAVISDGLWQLVRRTDGVVTKTLRARELWAKINYAAWSCADPGLQYHTTINEWHTCPKDGEINASNPCSEYMFLDDTACNLASINLAHFYDSERRVFDVEAFKHACRVWTIVLEVSVLMAQFPSREIAQRSYDFRTLGLGYANLGTILMTAGIPYDSDPGRAWAGAITAIMTGEAYATSAEMAREVGPFPAYKRNAKHMLRIIRNHRRAAWNAPTDEYEELTITPVALNPQLVPENMLHGARECWDRALAIGDEHGYRNAQTTCIAPTGTIALVMDCDTTGIEPDFAMVKFKKLAGGGYFKIVNTSVPRALLALGYSEAEIVEIEHYMKGHGTLSGCPNINRASLKSKGFTDDKLDIIEGHLDSVFDIRFAFNKWTLGEEFLRGLGFDGDQLDDPSFDLLGELGFGSDEIDAANRYVCGTMTIEGAPGLKVEHLPAFDCANKCGRHGERYIQYMGHVRMMAAAQPFISGAISKTINMPSHATVDEVDLVYMESWRLMLKAIALYRDGSKLSQPLNVTSDTDLVEEVTIRDVDVEPLRMIGSDESWNENVGPMQVHEQIIEKVYHRAERRRLPKRRHGFVREAIVGGHKVFIRTGEYEDGTLGEVFIDMYKEGASFKGLLNCFAVLASKALQFGMPLEKMVDTFTFTRFEPAGPVYGHEAIKSTTSIIDYVFRALGYEYLGRTDFVHVKAVDELHPDNPAGEGRGGSGQQALSPGQELYYGQRRASAVKTPTPATSLSRATSAVEGTQRMQSAKAHGYTGDQCSNCGSMRVKQNGACHVCEDCGTTSGCS